MMEYRCSISADSTVARLLMQTPGFLALKKHLNVNGANELMRISTIDCLWQEVTEIDEFITDINGLKIYRNCTGYKFILPQIQVCTDSEFFDICIHYRANALIRVADDAMLILLHVFRYRLLTTSGIGIHSATIVSEGKAIAFCGLSGAGKSTQANLWIKQKGAWPLNFDKPAIWFADDEVYALGTPWSGKERCYTNVSVPLRCIVFVMQNKENYVKRLSSAEAFSRLFPNYMVYPIDDRIIAAYEHAIMEIVRRIPVYELFCTKEALAVEVLAKELKMEGIQRYMKVKDGFIVRNIADEWIVIARGKKALEFSATIILNETGVFLWNLLKNETSEEQLACALMDEYGIDRDTALNDVNLFVEQLYRDGVLEIREG